MSKSTSTPETTTKPDALALVEQVAKATKLDGVSVETRQKSKRPVIVITDEHGTRLLAYVSPITQGAQAGGFAIEIADYGDYRRESVKTVAAAAKAVKTSKRVKPKAKPEPKPKATPAPETTPEPASDTPASDETKASA